MALFRSTRNLLMRPQAALRTARTLWFDKKEELGPDHIDHATGNEKLLLILNEKGIDDPFMIDKAYPRGPATKDQTHICYMWVHKEEPKRCECGHWFKVVEATDLRQLAYGKTEDSPEMF